MKVTVERAELLKSLGHVHRVVERRNTIPILANVLIKADKGKLSMKATDLDLEVIDSVAAEVSPGGATTVPGRFTFRSLKSRGSMPSSSASMSIWHSMAKLICGLPAPLMVPEYGLLV